MTKLMTGVAFAALVAAAPAYAETDANKQIGPAQTAEQPANSGLGVQGPPDTRTGPATKAPGDSAADATAPDPGASSAAENSTQPTQDSSGVKGLPGNKSGASQSASEKAAAPSTDRMGGAEPAENPAQASTKSGSGGDFIVTEASKKEWIGKSVYSSDGKNLGEVADLKTGPDNKLTNLEADIGGFLGFGATRVSIGADKIKDLKTDRIVLSVNEADTHDLPRVQK